MAAALSRDARSRQVQTVYARTGIQMPARTRSSTICPISAHPPRVHAQLRSSVTLERSCLSPGRKPGR